MSRLLPLNFFSPMTLVRPMQTRTESQVYETGRGGGSKERRAADLNWRFGGAPVIARCGSLPMFGSRRRGDELIFARQCLPLAPLPRTSTEQWTEQSGCAPDVVRAPFLDWQLAGEVAPSRTLRSHA